MNAAADLFDVLVSLVKPGSVLLLSGAGISTESGIPDYRGPTGRRRASDPIQYREFVSSAAARRRYWARSAVGWPHVRRAEPNAGHRAVAELERAGLLSGVITQNVDGLHQAAGSRTVVELHGTLYRVVCLGCGALSDRDTLQQTMLLDNPDWNVEAARITPDGDAVLPQPLVDSFRPPRCERCGGALKPQVVLFGENVPCEVVQRAWDLLERSRTVLVVGSSLSVYSGYRFADRAAREGKPVALLNQGYTRADRLAALKIEAPIGRTLARLVDRLSDCCRDGIRFADRRGSQVQ
ncbi:MAG: NAD-dependent protein deacetylase [Spirochaetaceae bacterium]|nr:MAG: NAD-dependent protein deacetylase [Spirochaetaceae bacterium]